MTYNVEYLGGGKWHWLTTTSDLSSASDCAERWLFSGLPHRVRAIPDDAGTVVWPEPKRKGKNP